MTHTEKTIQDAVEGGFGSVSESSYGPHHYADLFLNRSFWEAVGKTRGWKQRWERQAYTSLLGEPYRWYANEFFQNVMEGDDYETALSKLI